ncbi:hypothetical protein [Pseudomonas sp. GCEP-101]|uniref:hypothetical protein n=1 Tax=Pseudomonas sp. GCEP-101 TaxID=2974552 RepID=UPI00223BE8A0|nr:hypothetical protein [Pseudomonas sp. GCEP-101]
MPATGRQAGITSRRQASIMDFSGRCPLFAGMARSYTGIHVVSFCWVIRDQLNCVQFN